MSGINWMDFVLILLLALGLAIGYNQGLLRQIVSLAALYLGAILATQYSFVLTNIFKAMFTTTPSTMLNTIAFFVIMFGVMGGLSLLALDAYRLKLNVFPLLDHLCGMLLGLVTAWIILALCLNVTIIATSVQSWESAEGLRQALHDGIAGSRVAEATDTTVPMLIAAIKPWLPAGLPTIFNM